MWAKVQIADHVTCGQFRMVQPCAQIHMFCGLWTVWVLEKISNMWLTSHARKGQLRLTNQTQSGMRMSFRSLNCQYGQSKSEQPCSKDPSIQWGIGICNRAGLVFCTPVLQQRITKCCQLLQRFSHSFRVLQRSRDLIPMA